MKNKALFLDRDGVINSDKTYIYRFEDIDWVAGIFDLITFANAHGYLVIVLTNQSGVAQGMYKEQDVIELHKKMNAYLQTINVRVDDWLYCTEYDSERRKPRPGMMKEAAQKFNIDLDKSFMIGDKESDILEIVGPKTYLLQGKYPLQNVLDKGSVEVFSSLYEILEKFKIEVTLNN